MTPIEKFKNLLLATSRKGVEETLRWLLEKTPFTQTPASKGHGNHPGGLLEHSLNVFELASDLYLGTKGTLGRAIDFSMDSVIISALLHDVCKAYGPITPMNYHGAYSVDLLKEHGLFLLPQEVLAIRYHMGPTLEGDPKEAWEAYRKTPLIGIIQWADANAALFLEK